jgi:hypothetical protein
MAKVSFVELLKEAKKEVAKEKVDTKVVKEPAGKTTDVKKPATAKKPVAKKAPAKKAETVKKEDKTPKTEKAS